MVCGHSHRAVLIAGQSNQIFPGGLFVGDGGEGGAKSAGSRYSHIAILVAGQSNQIFPGGLFVGDGGEGGAKSVGSHPSHKTVLVACQSDQIFQASPPNRTNGRLRSVLVACQSNQIFPGGLFFGKIGKISAQSINRFSAIFDIIANALSMNLCLVDQIPAPQTL